MQQMIFIAELIACSPCFGAPLCPSSGAREYYTGGGCFWYLVLWFSSCRYSVELRVMCPICWLLQVKQHYTVFYRKLLPVVFDALVFKLSVWCVAATRKPDTQPSAPHHADNFNTKAPNITGSNHLYNTLELLMMGIMVSETC